jgi:hypothetical protein
VTFLDPLVPGNTVRIQIVASQAGRIDAWMDLNLDGDWNDSGEKVLVSHDVAAGVNTVNVAIPEVTPEGVTYARFRLSREGGLAATGLALNGEVEDYRVVIVSEAPWYNASRPVDVNRDGLVVPMDALLVINELNNHVFSDRATGLLPNPPQAPHLPANEGFVDTDGDGYVSPRDALLVINELNAPTLPVVPQPVRRLAASVPAWQESSGAIAAALTPAPAEVEVDHIQAGALDELVTIYNSPSAKPLDVPITTASQVLPDPRLQEYELELAVDDFVEEVVKTLGDDDVWFV